MHSNRSTRFLIATVAIFFLFGACAVTEESAEVPCTTPLDCPIGMDCVDFICVEGGADTTPTDKDMTMPDTVTDDELPDDIADITPVDGDITDTALVDDQPIIVDDDTVLTDDLTDELLPDDDALLTDETTDTLQNDSDDLLTDEPLPDDLGDDSLLGDEDGLVSDDDTVLPESVTIGTGTDTQWIPIGCRYFKYSRSAALYTATEIGYSATVTKLAWYDATGAATSRPIKIYLKDTAEGTLSAASWATAITGATEVFAGDIATAFGWNEFTLATPFAHSGSNNLLVLVEMNKGDFTSDEPAFRYTDTPGMHEAWQADSIPTGNGSVNGSRPNITISF